MRTFIVVAVAGLLLGAGLPARAEKQSPPKPGTPKSFQVPTPQRFTLDNGLAVTFVDYGTIPKVRVQLTVDVGNANETATQVWLADITGDLLIEGSKTRSALEISEAAARMGGSLEVGVGAETTAELGGAVLSEFGPEMVRLVADVVRHPAFPESELERIKNDRQRQLSIARSQSQQLATEKVPGGALRRRASVRARLSHPGDDRRVFAEGRPRLLRGGLRPEAGATLRRGPLRPAAVEAPQSGRPSAAGPVPPRRRVARPFAPEHPEPGDRRSSGRRSDHPHARAARPRSARTRTTSSLSVTNTLLGGFFSSRITTNIREDKGYTYSPFSQVSSRRGDAYWVQNADVSTEVTAPALKEILFEIDRLRNEPPSREELDGVQSYMAGVFVLRNSSRAGIINQLEFLVRHGLPDDYLRQYVDKVLAVTPDDVQEMTREVHPGRPDDDRGGR